MIPLSSKPRDPEAPTRRETLGAAAQPPPAPARREVMPATAMAGAAAALFVAPVFSRWDLWGICDWDQHQFFYGAPFWSIVRAREWPFWNPFACGGSPLLADPQSPALYPLFAVVLALGVVPGLKVLIWAHAALAIFGAWLLGRRCGCGPIAAWLPAAAFGLSSAYALHLATGHATWFAMAYLPLALAALRRGFARPRLALAAGAAAAMILFIGNGYLFAHLILVAGLWAALVAIQRRSWSPFGAFALMGLSALGLSAIKLLPMLDFVRKVTSVEMGDASAGNLVLLWNSLLGRDQGLRAYEGILPGQAWRWWEYGAYVGPVIVILACGYAARRIGRAWPLVALTAFVVLLTLGAGWGVWDLLRALPVFDSLRVPSRAIAFAVLFLGVMAGLQVTEWEPRVPRYLLAAGVALVAFDIGYVGRSPLEEAFVVAPHAREPGDFQQSIGTKDFQGAWDPAARRYTAAYTDLYPGLLANRGTVNCYNRFHLPIRAQPDHLPDGSPNPSYRGEAWSTSGGPTRVLKVGGRRIEVGVEPAGAGVLVLNQNYDDGWRTEDGRRVRDHGGLVAAAVNPEDHRVVFLYTPPWFLPGAALSLLSVVAVIAGAALRRGEP